MFSCLDQTARQDDRKVKKKLDLLMPLIDNGEIRRGIIPLVLVRLHILSGDPKVVASDERKTYLHDVLRVGDHRVQFVERSMALFNVLVEPMEILFVPLDALLQIVVLLLQFAVVGREFEFSLLLLDLASHFGHLFQAASLVRFQLLDLVLETLANGELLVDLGDENGKIVLLLLALVVQRFAFLGQQVTRFVERFLIVEKRLDLVAQPARFALHLHKDLPVGFDAVSQLIVFGERVLVLFLHALLFGGELLQFVLSVLLVSLTTFDQTIELGQSSGLVLFGSFQFFERGFILE